MRRFQNMEGQGQASLVRRLICDEIGVALAPVPTVNSTPTNMNDDTGSYRLSLLLGEALDSVKLVFARDLQLFNSFASDRNLLPPTSTC